MGFLQRPGGSRLSAVEENPCRAGPPAFHVEPLAPAAARQGSTNSQHHHLQHAPTLIHCALHILPLHPTFDVRRSPVMAPIGKHLRICDSFRPPTNTSQTARSARPDGSSASAALGEHPPLTTARIASKADSPRQYHRSHHRLQLQLQLWSAGRKTVISTPTAQPAHAHPTPTDSARSKQFRQAPPQRIHSAKQRCPETVHPQDFCNPAAGQEEAGFQRCAGTRPG